MVDNGAGKVYRETVSGSSYFQSVIAAGLSGPNGSIAVDGSGNVYVADTGNSRVLKETLAGGSYTQSVVVDTTTVNHQPTGVAVNSLGTVFISYANNGTYAAIPNGALYTAYEISPDGGAGVTTDAKQAVYVADENGLVKLTPNELAVDSGSAKFGSHDIGSDGGTQTVTFTFAVASTLSSSPFAVSMQGNLQADFQAAATQPGNVCVGGHTYAVGDTCSVAAHFSPTRPGVRYGAVVIFQISNAPVGTAYLQGEGVGPQVSFSPGTIRGPYNTTASLNIAEDGQGGVIFDGLDGIIDLFRPSTKIQYSVATGFSSGNPSPLLHITVNGLGVDGAGNVLEKGYGQQSFTTLVEIDSFVLNPYISPYDPSTNQLQGRFGDLFVATIDPAVDSNTSPFLADTSVAADGSRNIYFSDQNGNRVLKESWTGGGYNQQSVVGDGFNNPGDVVVDNSGDVFVLDTGNNRVVKETPSDSGYTASTIVDNLASPQSLAIDRLGNLYITLAVQSPPFAPAVLKETLVNGSYQSSSLIVQDSQGVAVDAAGNVSTAYNQNVNQLDVADPPQLRFASTAVGTKSSDSPQIITLVNNGNEDLTFSVPTSGDNPAITTGFTLDTSSTCPILNTSSGTGTLRVGSSCTLAVNFIPTQSGTDQGTLTITDNHLDVPGSTQVVPLNGPATGTGTGTVSATLTPATYDYGNVTTGTSASQVFTLANTGTASITINSASLPSAIFTVASTTCGMTLAAGANCTYTIVFAPTAAGMLTTTFSVGYDFIGLSSSLTGTGVAAVTTAPQAALTPASVDFGSITTGSTSSARTFTLSNAGNAALPITSVGVTGANASAFVMSSNACGTSLAAGASCAVSISFHAATPEQETATLSVVDSVGIQTASLTGISVATGVAADFTLVGKPASQTGARGTPVSFTVLLGSADPNNPFTQLVNLSATGLPAGATVTFAPNSAVPGATNAATSTMTVTIPTLTAQLDRSSHDGMMLAGVSGVSLLFCFGLTGSRRRHSLRLLTLVIFAFAGFAVTTLLTGCGSGTGFAPPGSISTITVTGTSGNIVHSTALTLVVK